MSGNPVLSLLGLALRGGRLEVGGEPVSLAVKAGRVRLVLLASDAAGNLLRRAEHLAEEGRCLWLITPFSKAELGGALGRGSAAIAALTDLGLAGAVCQRLAVQDPERYGSYASRMELKQRRAEERKASPRRNAPAKSKPVRNGSPQGGRSAFSKDRPRDGKPASGKDRPQGGRPPSGKGRPPRRGSPASGRDRPQDGRPPSGREHPRGGRPAFGKGRPPQGKRPPGKGGKGRPPGGRGGGR